MAINIKRLIPRSLKEYVYGAYTRRFHPERIIGDIFRRQFGRDIDLDNPRDVNEKVQWLKLHSDLKAWALLADKYRVREHVSGKGYGDTLTRLYGVYRKASEIDFDSLPDAFVIKTNFRSGDTLIVRDKNSVDLEKVRTDFDKLMHKRFGDELYEPHYSHIKRRIIVEQLIDRRDQDFESCSLIDYKFWCINGRPYYIEVIYDRTKSCVTEQIYTLDWQLVPDGIIESAHCKEGKEPLPRPRALDKMLQMATDLSAGIPLARIDFYFAEGKIYFGEITLTPAGGFENALNQDLLLEMGKALRLPGKDT